MHQNLHNYNKMEKENNYLLLDKTKLRKLSRKDMSNLIPIEDYEGNYPITVDGVECEGKLNITPRLFYTILFSLSIHISLEAVVFILIISYECNLLINWRHSKSKSNNISSCILTVIYLFS